MRDPIVERFVQPVVDRRGLDPSDLAGLCATLFGATCVADASVTLSRLHDAIGPMAFTVVSMVVTNALWRNRSTSGASGPHAVAHFVGRSVMLAIGLASTAQTLLAFAIAGTTLAGPHHDARLMIKDVCAFVEPMLIAASMYLSACRKPPPGRRRSVAEARAES